VAAPGLLAQLIISKFCDHLPLYRQEQIYWNRHRVWLPRASQARWMGLCAQWLYPVYQQIKSTIMNGSYIQVDETPIKYLDPGNGKCAQGYLWVAGQPAETWFLIGIPRERPVASKNSSPLILKAPSNAMVIAPTIVLPACGPKKANH
jgi:Transposase IS66 family